MTKAFNKNIKEIESGIQNLSSLNEKQVLELSKKINLEACSELCHDRKQKYANENYLQQIINLASIFKENSVILRNIVSAVGFICTRSSFYSDTGFLFLKQNLQNENNIVKIAIVKNIYKFPQFASDEDSWHFLLDIPKISPKKESIEYFYRTVHKHIGKIPSDILVEAKNCLRKYIDKHKINEYQKKDFESLIEMIITRLNH